VAPEPSVSEALEALSAQVRARIASRGPGDESDNMGPPG
jgi:hypothetical protein